MQTRALHGADVPERTVGVCLFVFSLQGSIETPLKTQRSEPQRSSRLESRRLARRLLSLPKQNTVPDTCTMSCFFFTLPKQADVRTCKIQI